MYISRVYPTFSKAYPALCVVCVIGGARVSTTGAANMWASVAPLTNTEGDSVMALGPLDRERRGRGRRQSDDSGRPIGRTKGGGARSLELVMAATLGLEVRHKGVDGAREAKP